MTSNYEIDGRVMDSEAFKDAVNAMTTLLEQRPEMDGMKLLDLERSTGANIDTALDTSEYNVIKTAEWFDDIANMKFANVEMLATALGITKQGLNKTILRRFPESRVDGHKGVNIWHGSDRDGDLDARYPDGGLSMWLMEKALKLSTEGKGYDMDLWACGTHGRPHFKAAFERTHKSAQTGVNQRRTRSNTSKRKRDMEKAAAAVVAGSSD